MMFPDLTHIHFRYPDIPTMISEDEKRYLYWLASKIYTGQGVIVEIGPWLGGSTFCLAAGLAHNSLIDKKKIVVYDNFIWRQFMQQRYPLPIREGESFLPFFNNFIQEYSDLISAHQESLPDENISDDSYLANRRQRDEEIKQLVKHKGSDKVEVLFIDGAKSWSGMKYLLQEFNRYFIPGKTLFVCQDYKFWGCYWVIIILEMFSEQLSIEHILSNNTVSFKLDQPISENEINHIPDFSVFGIEEGLQLIENAAQRLDRFGDKLGGRIVRINKVRFLFNKGEKESALKMFFEIEKAWPLMLNSNHLDHARSWLSGQMSDELLDTTWTKFKRISRKATQKIKNLKSALVK